MLWFAVATVLLVISTDRTYNVSPHFFLTRARSLISVFRLEKGHAHHLHIIVRLAGQYADVIAVTHTCCVTYITRTLRTVYSCLAYANGCHHLILTRGCVLVMEEELLPEEVVPCAMDGQSGTRLCHQLLPGPRGHRHSNHEKMALIIP
jgi:hypothetical protein